jgi:hypothetical protein
MRGLAALCAACMLTGCASSDTPDNREAIAYADGRILPYGKIHPSDAGGDSMSVRFASHYLRAMNEPRLDPKAFAYDVYRLTYMPSFRPVASLRLMRRPTGCLYVRKEVTPVKVPEDSLQIDTTLRTYATPLRISAVDSVPVGSLECNVIIKDMKALQLGSRPETNFNVGPDGEMWLFEEIRSGRYNAREVWSPDSTRNAPFYTAGMTFIRVARYGGKGFPARPTTYP